MSTTQQTLRGHTDLRWVLIVALYVTTAMWAVGQLFVGQHAEIVAAANIVIAMQPTIWIILDAERRGKPILHILQPFVFVAWWIIVPIYLIVTRRLYGLGLVLLHAVGLVLVTSGFFYGTIYICWGPEAFYVGP